MFRAGRLEFARSHEDDVGNFWQALECSPVQQIACQRLNSMRRQLSGQARDAGWCVGRRRLRGARPRLDRVGGGWCGAVSLAEAFGKVDALLTPTAPSAAFGLGENASDPVAMYLNDIFTVTVNLAGLPGLSVPAGLDAQGLPLGLQLIGRALDEGTLFQLGAALEKAADFRSKPMPWWRAQP